MEIIEKLQRSRPEIVHIFDEIVKTLPDGAYLTGVKQTDQKFRFDGVAQSATRVSTFMRNIDASQWLKNPELQVVAADGTTGGSSFTVFADEVPSGGDTGIQVAPGPRPGVPRNGGVRRGVSP
jgi:type IV pilus assembly protein PilN